MRCLQHFSSKIILEKHIGNCLEINGEQKVKLNNGYVSFKNYSNKTCVPFKIYADFEYILKENKKYSDKIGNKNDTWSAKMQSHIPCGYGYKVVCLDEKFTNDLVVYRGIDCMSKFVDAILGEYEYCKYVMSSYFNKTLIMSAEEEKEFWEANKCWICERLFNEDDEASKTSEKVRDHCHISGKFTGAAHKGCNLNLNLMKRYL